MTKPLIAMVAIRAVGSNATRASGFVLYFSNRKLHYLCFMLSLTNKQSAQLQDICNKHMVKNLYIFGSATNNRFDAKSSDIDLVVDFSEDLEILSYADNYFSLLKDLEHLFEKKVDLISYKALRNPVMIEEVEKSKVSLYAA